MLNQGGYGSNNATLDYVDLATGQYHAGYFESRNPDMAYGLGDTGNDIFISDGLLFIIMNGPGIVEIASADDARHIAQVEVPNCRYGTVSDGYLYVTSYASEGTLYKISLADYKVVATLKTGYEPEQLLCLDGFLYILNSGGLHYPEYDDTITVVDLSGFSVDRTVDTGYRNLYKILYADGTIYVTSRGDYDEDPGAVFIFDPETDGITPVLDKPVSNWSYFNGTVYTQSTIYDDSWNETAMFGKITGGLGALYNVTSYASDILSYSRLLALGLATGVIAQVVNTVGTLAGGGVKGAIIMVLAFFIGHTFNLAINALGAFVHTSRLQYIEFFGKFYEDGGEEFTPLRRNTKYIKLSDDTDGGVRK